MRRRAVQATLAVAALAVVSCGPKGEGDPGSVLLDDGSIAAGALGPIDPEATGAVLPFVLQPPAQHLAAEPNQAWQDARAAVVALGIRAIPVIAQQLRRRGCGEADGHRLVGLLQELSDAVGFEAARSIAVSDLMLEIVARTGDVPTPASPEWDAALAAAGEGGPAAVSASELAAAVEASLAPPITLAADKRVASRRCVDGALNLVRYLKSRERIAPADLETLTRKHLANLPDGSTYAIPLLGFLDLSVPSEREEALAFEAMAQDAKWHPEARGVACEAAIRRNNRMKASVPILEELAPPVLVCILERGAGREWFDHGAARKLLDHDDVGVRLAAIASLVAESAGTDFDPLLVRLDHLRKTDGRLRESTALLRAVTDIVRLNPEIRERALASIGDPDLRAAVETDDVHSEFRAPPERFARDHCDWQVTDADAARAALAAGGAGVTVCLADGDYAGSIALTERGQRLVSLTGGGATLEGDLVLAAPAVAVGLKLGGGLVLAPTADGSVVLGVHATGRSAVLSERSLVVGFGSEGGLVALAEALTAPTSGPAGELAIHVPKSVLEQQGSLGGALGWADAIHFRAAPGTPWAVSLDAPTIHDWTTAGLARHRPDRVPMEADDRWVPLYGAFEPTTPTSGLAIPLRPAPWRLRHADLVVLDGS